MMFLFRKFLILFTFIFLLGIYETNDLMANRSSAFSVPEGSFFEEDNTQKIISSLSKEGKIPDISSSFSGSLDFNELDTNSYEIKDFLDLSKNFYISPGSLGSSDSYSAALSTLSGCFYYGCRTVAEITLLPFIIAWNLDGPQHTIHGFDAWYHMNGSFPPTDRVSFYRNIQLKNIEDSLFWGKSTAAEPYRGMYKETSVFSYNLLNKYYSRLNIGSSDSSENKRKNVFVFISNSPSIPIKVFLDSLKSQSSTIKNQKIRSSVENSIFVDVPFSIELLNQNLHLEDNDIFNHFSKYIDPSVIEGNNLIFVDLAWDGVMIGSFIRNFKRYLVNSGVKEHALYADIHTFFPEGLRSYFLNRLSTLPNINVQYSNKYFSYLMKNVFFMMYDNTLLYFLNENNFANTSDLGRGFVLWKGAIFLPLDHYAWYTVNKYDDEDAFFNAIFEHSSYRLRNKDGNQYINLIRFRSFPVEKFSSKTSLPYKDFEYSKLSRKMFESDLYNHFFDAKKGIFRTDYRGVSGVYNTSIDWVNSIRDDSSIESKLVDGEYDLIGKYFTSKIQEDPRFMHESLLCSLLFQE